MLRKDILIYSLICGILGALLVRQFYATKAVEKIKKGDKNQLLALEVSRLIKANDDLRSEIKDLGATSEKYQKSVEDRKSASEEVTKNLEKYQILAGVTKIDGTGVEIKIDGDVGQEQMVDLVNALRNIGVEGLSINNKRFVISSSFRFMADGLFLDNTKLERPYTVITIGNAVLIKEALERKGGIIEQIKSSSRDIKIEVIQKDKVILEPIS
ncbi:MAG: DUF881 domain-containing protein [Candidatus Berkelbacteria bacterium]|nr:DUF881 domain-containing protein [Candidatus Berkelbacteria bacterium]